MTTDTEGHRRYATRLSVPQMQAVVRLIQDQDEEDGDEVRLDGVVKILKSTMKDVRSR